MTRLKTQWMAAGLRDTRSGSRAGGLVVVLLLVMLAIGLAMLLTGAFPDANPGTTR